jgi:hypothetical protein
VEKGDNRPQTSFSPSDPSRFCRERVTCSDSGPCLFYLEKALFIMTPTFRPKPSVSLYERCAPAPKDGLDGVRTGDNDVLRQSDLTLFA